MMNIGFSLILLVLAFFVFDRVDEKSVRYFSDEEN